jgi:hypothetical protein
MSTAVTGPDLIEAVNDCNIEKVKELIELGAPMDYKNEVKKIEYNYLSIVIFD